MISREYELTGLHTTQTCGGPPPAMTQAADVTVHFTIACT